MTWDLQTAARTLAQDSRVMTGIINNQEWKSVPFAPHYEVSEFGAVRRICSERKVSLGRLLKTRRHSFGYPVVHLRRPDKDRYWPCEIHTIVASAYLPPKPFDKAQVAHIDGDVSNNHWRNLMWATQRENMGHAIIHGTIAKGERNGWATLTAQDVLAIRQEASDGHMQAVIASRHGISFQQVSRIVRRERWGWL